MKDAGAILRSSPLLRIGPLRRSQTCFHFPVESGERFSSFYEVYPSHAIGQVSTMGYEELTWNFGQGWLKIPTILLVTLAGRLRLI